MDTFADIDEFELKIQKEINEAATQVSRDSSKEKTENEVQDDEPREDDDIPVEVVKNFLAVKAKLDPLTHIKGLKNLVPTENAEKNAKATLDRIKARIISFLTKRSRSKSWKRPAPERKESRKDANSSLKKIWPFRKRKGPRWRN